MTTDYPGNSALPGEVKQRVLSTFRQTLDLYNQALLDDVIVGCEFLLKMDPLFQPAKKLMEKAKNPASNVDVEALMALVGSAPPASAAPATGGTASTAGGDVLAEARTALADREFQRALDLSSEILSTDMMNEEAQRIAEQARERMEADPFIQQFASKVRQQIEQGDAAAARSTLEKARGLDPDHPVVHELQSEVTAAESRPAFDPLSTFGVSDDAKSGDEPAAAYDFMSFNPETPAPPPEPEQDSFVVDPGTSKPADPSRGSASASDFGFTFEEDQGEGPEITLGHTEPGTFGFTGATQQEAAEAASGDTFDFSTASADLSGEDQNKIEDFLRQGDAAYEQLDYQKAIDIWSRIFLIDVTNDQASSRIEKAREKKAAIDDQVDGLMSEVAVALEKGDSATARKALEGVLAIDPSNAEAASRLAELPAGGSAAPPPSGPAPSAPVVPPAAAAASGAPSASAHPFDEPLYPEEPSAGAPSQPILSPPDPEGEYTDDEGAFAPPRTTPRPRAAAAEPSAGRSRALLYAAIALVVLVAGSYLGWTMLSSSDEPAVTEAPSDALLRAQRLAAAGNLDDAIATLLAIPPNDPSHDEALTLVAELRARRAQASGMVEGRPATEVFAELVAEGQRAAQANDFRTAKAALDRAATIQPLPPDIRELYDRISASSAAVVTAENLFKSGNYPQAIAAAEAVLQQNAGNTSARNLIRDARFNLGVQALQQERLQDAIAQFDQVLAMDPNDELARRARELAVRYESTPKDLLYRIFVKHLKTR